MHIEGTWYPETRMEEAETGGPPMLRPPIGFDLDEQEQRVQRRSKKSLGGDSPVQDAAQSRLLDERQEILKNERLTTRDKLRLLENNRRTLVVASGGTIRQSENVVYGILLFGGLLVAILALLTVFADLPSEITLSFVGTVLGGTIATIAQKLGKL